MSKVYAMKITKRQLKKLVEVAWSASPDNDYPANKFDKHTYRPVPGLKSQRVLYIKSPRFNPAEDPFSDYTLSGDTHARDSHALKHYAEWAPTDVANVMEEIKQRIIDEGQDVYMYMGPKSPVQQINPQDIIPGDLINTLDRINDSLINGEFVNFIERQMYKNYFIPLALAYESMADTLIGAAIDVSDNNPYIGSVQALVQLLMGSPIIKFNGVYRGTGDVMTYFYDMQNTVLASAAGPNNPGIGPFATIFKMTKQNRNETPRQALRHFKEGKGTTPEPSTHTKFIQAIQIISP
jgi:hypothetical protein